MATLVLTAVGGALGQAIGIGSAVGGAIGALAGRSLDALIFAPGTRTGPRLNDLQVQTSRYGVALPRLYGTLRVAGTVIWSTDLQEASTTEGGGKGQPGTTRFSYSASFAVALSARRINSIGRIWADGNLLRGAAGDLKFPLGAFRVHVGSENQPVDPLIAAAVGMDQAPAYRGCAYVVFEELQLEAFGNRIPSLTFEVVADAGPLRISSIASDLTEMAIGYLGDTEEPVLSGFAAEGGMREATSALIDVHDLLWREGAGELALVSGRPVDRTLDPGDAVLAVDGQAEQPGRKQRTPLETVPVRLAIRHHDPARDFQVGIQTAERPGPGARSHEIDLPAVLSADDARGLADRKLRSALRRRQSVQRSMGWDALDLAVGDVVSLGDEAGSWLVESSDWDEMALRLRLRAIDTGVWRAPSAGEAGEVLRETDLVQGATRLAIVELPGGDGTLASTPSVFAAATGADAGWRRATLLRFRSELEMAEPIGWTAPRAVLGITLDALADGAPWRIDRRSSVEILLDNTADALVSAEDELLLQGANLCQIGEELLQFGHAEPIGPRRYRLSRLIRGWRGTEWACGGHGDGERFVLVDPTRLMPMALAAADIGRTFELRAIGRGDAVPAEAARQIDGRAMMPPSPVHGRIEPEDGGDLRIRWIRRSRLGWTWPSGTDAPIGEEFEAYVLRIMAGSTLLREWETGLPTSLYSAADHAGDLAAGAPWPLRLEVRQRGTWGVSLPLSLDIP
jgi:hypothetical protein